MWLTIFLYLIIIILSESISIEDLRESFGSEKCVQGTLSSFSLQKSDTFIKDLHNDYETYLVSNTSEEINMDLSPLIRLNELAQYNEIKYFFTLTKEDGPPHDKTFTVSLTLGDEEYISDGRSLKKAKQNVAKEALKNTKYDVPPLKYHSENDESLTPTVLLNNLCMKLGIAANYFLIDRKEDVLASDNSVSIKPKKSYLQKLNDSIFSNNNLHITKDDNQIQGPFKIKVQIGDKFFYGTAHTIQSARHEAASKALDYIIKNKEEFNQGSEEQIQKAKQSLISPISLVYEAAQLRNLEIEFEIIEESGPSHNKKFVTKCTLGHLSTTGEGKSKKQSKLSASQNMLERISELPPVSQQMQVKSMLKVKKNRKKKKIIKTSFDKISMVIDEFIDSVLKFKNKQEKYEEQPDTFSGSEVPKGSKSLPKKLNKSYQEEILKLSNFLNVEIEFIDTKDKEEYYSLLSLHIEPQYICIGQGTSEKGARNQAAKEGLKLLYDIGFYDHSKVQNKNALLESETMEYIKYILEQESTEENKY